MVVFANTFGGTQQTGVCLQNFNSEGVNALVDKFLQGIIHKAMLGNAALSSHHRRMNTHPEMRTESGAVGTGVTRVITTFIDHFKPIRCQALCQNRMHLLRERFHHWPFKRRVHHF